MEPNDGRGGHVAVVTGGTGEIGQVIAARLLARRQRVHCLDLKGSTRQAAMVSAPVFHKVDVTDESEVDGAFKEILRCEGRIDYMIYCAGIFRPYAITDMPIDEFSQTLAVNLTGAFLCCRAAMHAMRVNRFGRIVLLSSLIASLGRENGAHYAASKGGLLGLVCSLAPTLREFGILINAVSPGVVDTAMPRAHSSADQLAQVARSIPLQRIARTEDVAEACLFLLEDNGECLTGQNLAVNGGAL